MEPLRKFLSLVVHGSPRAAGANSLVSRDIANSGKDPLVSTGIAKGRASVSLDRVSAQVIAAGSTPTVTLLATKGFGLCRQLSRG
jgi:hypothetical protein